MTIKLINTINYCHGKGQFSSETLTDMLIDAGIQIGVVGRGRIFENSMIAGLWRYLKDEKAHLKNCGDFIDARKKLSAYFLLYRHNSKIIKCNSRDAPRCLPG